MSIDAIALLKVSAAKARKSVPDPARVIQLGPDACGVSLFEKHVGLDVRPAQTAAIVQATVGDALALHTDPRGVLLYPDVAEPSPAKYDVLVSSLEEASFWVVPTLLAKSSAALEELDEEEDRDGGFIERLGGLIEREGRGRTAPIVSVDLHQTTPSPDDFMRLSEITTLRALDLRRVVTLTRGALVQLGNLQNLERLTLDELKIGDEELSLLAEMSSLSSLSVIKTRIQGSGFAALARLPAFKEIVIGYTPLDDDGLRDIAKLPHLEVLKLAPSNVTDVGIGHVAKHRRLRVLDASRTRVTDAVVPALVAAPALERVMLRGTAVTAAGVGRLRKRSGLEVLHEPA
jgi:hypothetical protein